MRIHLPVETWIEILDWLRRRDLVKKLDSLWDREFTPIMQDWLHKYTRNVKIGKLRATDDGLSVHSNGQWQTVPFANVNMPRNVTSFEHIEIRYLDSAVLTMVRQMRPLLHNIHLVIDNGFALTQNQTALHLLLPIIRNGPIDSISFLDLNSSNFLQFFSINHPAALSNAKLLKIWENQLTKENEQILVDWLFTERDDGEARMLVFWTWKVSGLYEKIRERFMDAARQCASPFFVLILIGYRYDAELANVSETKNARTGEQLTFRTVEHDDQRYELVTNWPLNSNLEWLDKKTKEVLEWDVEKQQQTILLESLKISPQLYAEDDANQQQQVVA